MKFNVFPLLLVLALCLGIRVHADSPASPRSYTTITKNGKYVFVMLAHRSREQDTLKEKYPGSGLYANDGSTTALWRVGWYAFHVDVSSDGHHIVKGGDWPQAGDQGETEAVSFYRDGREIESYLIKDLVPRPEAMPRSVSHYSWCRVWNFDDQKNQLTIETYDGQNSPSKKYVFDVTTGKPVKP